MGVDDPNSQIFFVDFEGDYFRIKWRTPPPVMDVPLLDRDSVSEKTFVFYFLQKLSQAACSLSSLVAQWLTQTIFELSSSHHLSNESFLLSPSTSSSSSHMASLPLTDVVWW